MTAISKRTPAVIAVTIHTCPMSAFRSFPLIHNLVVSHIDSGLLSAFPLTNGSRRKCSICSQSLAALGLLLAVTAEAV